MRTAGIASDGAEAGTFSGYAALFDRTDFGGDRIERGAFEGTLKRRGAAGVRMLWSHDPARPVGVWTRIAEDRRGLFVEGRLTLSTSGGREAFALIRAGAIDGLSIGFRTLRARRGDGTARRRLIAVDLWEISLVTFPMQPGARIQPVQEKSARNAHGLAAPFHFSHPFLKGRHHAGHAASDTGNQGGDARDRRRL